ncbi:hypothetical protein MVAC_16255 [Mycolicibacterium vaccae ATCC 25954]|uniref:DUF4126 domain-containing protein n=1 Tax=Mycolicibacterium vaccae ATCC 25954 TaxID=1194972 RepID=K0UZX5_MYCVA|nr:hypothetical protein MVAC_16255 [Mycolicibacterium vaccae ATCC 25954]
MTDPGAFAQSGQWIPVAAGAVVALVVSLTKSTVRPAADVATAGAAAPVLSTTEDLVSIGLVFAAILLPVLVLVVVVALAWAAVRLLPAPPRPPFPLNRVRTGIPPACRPSCPARLSPIPHACWTPAGWASRGWRRSRSCGR